MNEDKIEVGEYVRLDYGKIGKVIAVEKGSIMLDIASNRWVGICCIVKHSKNIIDLIEVGDYVNGHLIVNEIYGEDDNELYFEIEGGFNKAKYIGEKDIKSIVTKEQFKDIEYKV